MDDLGGWKGKSNETRKLAACMGKSLATAPIQGAGADEFSLEIVFLCIGSTTEQREPIWRSELRALLRRSPFDGGKRSTRLLVIYGRIWASPRD